MPPHSDRNRPKLPKARKWEDLELENEMLRMELAERNEENQLLRQEHLQQMQRANEDHIQQLQQEREEHIQQIQQAQQREDLLQEIRRLVGQERQPQAEAGEDAALAPTSDKSDGPSQ